MKIRNRDCWTIISIFLVGGLLMQIVPYLTRSEPIDWSVVGVRFVVLIILTAVFWLLFFRKGFYSDGSEGKIKKRRKDETGE